MEERQAFAFEVVPFAGREEPFTLEEFIGEAIRLVEANFVLIEDPEGDLVPILLVGRGTQIDAILWSLVTEDFQEHFLDRVVPATLDSVEHTMATLAVTTYLTEPAEDGPGSRRQEAVLLSALDISDDPTRELTLASEVHRSSDKAPRLGEFQVLEEFLAPAFARALRAPSRPD